jgi:6-phosphogluconolactonase
LIHAAAEVIASHVVGAVQSRGRATIALSGGSTPEGVYRLLGSDPLRSRIPWEKVDIFFGDERCVPPENPQSNFGMVLGALLKHIAIPLQNIHRIEGERVPSMAARDYEENIRTAFHSGASTPPRFDVILLGLGVDGHTASLFPGTPALSEYQKLVTDVYVGKLMAHRITVTFPLINNARHVLFLVSGENKTAILHEVFQGDALRYPAQHVRPVAGELRWLVDQAAASQLTTMPKQ